jgi:hypothetical protein
MRASSMVITVLSIFASLFPARYRQRWFHDADLDVKRGAILSGWAELVAAGFTLWLRYPAFYQAQTEAAYALMRARMHGYHDSIAEGVAGFGIGPMITFQYLFKPLNLLLVYLCIEGALRLLPAMVTSEVVPSLPLQLVAWLHGLGAARAREAALGERVPDEVLEIEGQHTLAIRSCRPKQWDHLITIRYKEQLFELGEEKHGEPPRRFVYLLRPAPLHKVVRGLHDYDPEEVMEK